MRIAKLVKPEVKSTIDVYMVHNPVRDSLPVITIDDWPIEYTIESNEEKMYSLGFKILNSNVTDGITKITNVSMT